MACRHNDSSDYERKELKWRIEKEYWRRRAEKLRMRIEKQKLRQKEKGVWGEIEGGNGCEFGEGWI